jgi:hypothetical protein
MVFFKFLDQPTDNKKVSNYNIVVCKYKVTSPCFFYNISREKKVTTSFFQHRKRTVKVNIDSLENAMIILYVRQW